MFFLDRSRSEMVTPDRALPGREAPIPTAARHLVFDRPLKAPVPEGMAVALFGMGCFWGVERIFWQIPGVWLTMAGYAGGYTPNPTYEEVCSGRTGHNEVVRVIFDPAAVSYATLLRQFWEGHDPTQGMRQGNDVGTQYRSGIYLDQPADQAVAEASRARYQERLREAGWGPITTEVRLLGPFYFAEAYHQQYLHKNPGGYCGLGGCDVRYPLAA